MRLVIQRAAQASVTVDGKLVSEIGRGLFILVGGEILAVSQFTLTASTKKGNRPSYIRAAGHDLAVPLYDGFCKTVGELLGKPVGRGIFGADMKCSLINDGPVTIIIDSRLKE